MCKIQPLEEEQTYHFIALSLPDEVRSEVVTISKEVVIGHEPVQRCPYHVDVDRVTRYSKPAHNPHTISSHMNMKLTQYASKYMLLSCSYLHNILQMLSYTASICREMNTVYKAMVL